MHVNKHILENIVKYLDNSNKYIFCRLTKIILNEYISDNKLIIYTSDYHIRYYLHNYKKISDLSVIIDYNDKQLVYYICNCLFPNLINISFNIDYNKLYNENIINNENIIYFDKLEYILLNKYLKIFFSNHINLVKILINNSYSLKDSTIILIINKCKKLKKLDINNCIGLTDFSNRIIEQLFHK